MHCFKFLLSAHLDLFSPMVKLQIVSLNSTFGSFLSCRKFYLPSALLGRTTHPTRFEKICALNRTMYLHRNAELGPQPIFHRGGNKVDLYQNYLEKLQKKKEYITFRRTQTVIEDKPVDDTFVTSLYQPKVYILREAVNTLKEYIRLDLTDVESNIFLNLQLEDIIKGKGKRKKTVRFVHTTELPHPTGSINKIVYLSEDEKKIEEAKRMGVSAAGSGDIIPQLIKGSISCDLIFTSSAYFAELASHVDFKRQFGNLLPSKDFGVTDDLAMLEPYLYETIYHNLRLNTTCSVNIGKASQSSPELEENMLHVLKSVHTLTEETKVDSIVTSASICCLTEPIQLNIDFLLFDADV